MAPFPGVECPYQAHETIFLHWHFFNSHPTSCLQVEEEGNIMIRFLECWYCSYQCNIATWASRYALAYFEKRPIPQLCKNSERSPCTPRGMVFLREHRLFHLLELCSRYSEGLTNNFSAWYITKARTQKRYQQQQKKTKIKPWQNQNKTRKKQI